MTLDDVIWYAEHAFKCSLGFPGRRTSANGYPYTAMVWRTYAPRDPVNEHILASRAVGDLRVIFETRKTIQALLWRFEPKMFYEEVYHNPIGEPYCQIYTRLWIDNCADYGPASRALHSGHTNHLKLVHSGPGTAMVAVDTEGRSA